MTPRYRLVFRGKYVPGLTPAEVAINLSALFRVPVERVQSLLLQEPAVIKHDLSLEEGNRYMDALAEAGLISHLEPLSADNQALPGGWDGIERRQGLRRQQGRDRRGQRRNGAIQPDRRSGQDRRGRDQS